MRSRKNDFSDSFWNLPGSPFGTHQCPSTSDDSMIESRIQIDQQLGYLNSVAFRRRSSLRLSFNRHPKELHKKFSIFSELDVEIPQVCGISTEKFGEVQF